MKSKFVKTLLVSSLVAAIATGCGDDKDNNKSADTQAKDAGSLVFVDWGGTNTDARIEKNGSVQKNVGSHSGSFQTVIPFLP